MKEWSLPFTDNYTGPFWSDGKWQGSTAHGTAQPTSQLDKYSQQHDAFYAVAGSFNDLDYADKRYYDQTRNMSFVPRQIGAIPLVANRIPRTISKALGGQYVGSEYGTKTMAEVDAMTQQPTKVYDPKFDWLAALGVAAKVAALVVG